LERRLQSPLTTTTNNTITPPPPAGFFCIVVCFFCCHLGLLSLRTTNHHTGTFCHWIHFQPSSTSPQQQQQQQPCVVPPPVTNTQQVVDVPELSKHSCRRQCVIIILPVFHCVSTYLVFSVGCTGLRIWNSSFLLLSSTLPYLDHYLLLFFFLFLLFVFSYLQQQ
jgi:hypothetical protein